MRPPRPERTDMFVNIDLALLNIKADETTGNGPCDNQPAALPLSRVPSSRSAPS